MTEFQSLTEQMVRGYYRALAERLAELPCGVRVGQPQLSLVETSDPNNVTYRMESTMRLDPDVPPGQVIWE